MPDVVIDFTQDDRATAKACGEYLAKLGYDVQWDVASPRRLKGRSAVRHEALAAKALVVVWSAGSVRSRPLQRQAEIAAATGRLIATHVKAVPPAGLPSEMRDF